MRVRLLLFAGLREAVGRKELILELPAETSLADVLAHAEREAPAIGRHRATAMVSLNRERAPLDAVVSDGDEVALLPPVSGGTGRAWVQAAPLSMDALLAEIEGPDCGGIATFTGVVRNRSRGHAIEHLEYEAYEPMAESEMRTIASRVADRWPVVRIAMSHRVGRLEIGDAAVMIATAAPHRAEAFDACRFAIDALKQSVPIWKKEFAEDGARWVEENP
jgi:molybdopterin synthase catalytic subunit